MYKELFGGMLGDRGFQNQFAERYAPRIVTDGILVFDPSSEERNKPNAITREKAFPYNNKLLKIQTKFIPGTSLNPPMLTASEGVLWKNEQLPEVDANHRKRSSAQVFNPISYSIQTVSLTKLPPEHAAHFFQSTQIQDDRAPEAWKFLYSIRAQLPISKIPFSWGTDRPTRGDARSAYDLVHQVSEDLKNPNEPDLRGRIYENVQTLFDFLKKKDADR